MSDNHSELIEIDGGYGSTWWCKECGAISDYTHGKPEVWNLPNNAPRWRDFRKERPADGQYVHFRCEGEDETEQAWYIEEQRRIKGPMIDIYPDQLSWFLWQPYVEPAPPTPAEIEAAMKGEE